MCFVMIKMMNLHRAALFLARLSAALASMAIAVADQSLEFPGELRAIRKHANATMPVRMLCARYFGRHLGSRVSRMALAKKVIIGAEFRVSLIRGSDTFQPRSMVTLPSHFETVVWITGLTGTHTLTDAFPAFGLSFMGAGGPWRREIFIPRALALLKSRLFATRIMAVLKSRRLPLNSYRRNERPTATVAGDFRQRLSLLRSLPLVAFYPIGCGHFTSISGLGEVCH